MPVKTDGSGNRYVEMIVEVPGTPEQVWHAIATGPGMAAWFVPTDVEEREGGALTFHLGPGMDSPGIVTGWEPPRRFAYEEREWMEGAPPVATEVIVETRSGDTCVIRMVHSLFTSSEEWDNQLESFESGWPSFFKILKLYLGHFPGQPATSFRIMTAAPGTQEEAWDALAGGLGLAGATTGDHWSATAGAPALAGVVEQVGKVKDHHEAFLRLEKPAPGAAYVAAFTWGGKVQAMVSVYLYGEGVEDLAAREEPVWQEWWGERFPAPVEETATAG
ncbi:MAG TPA: SRPBCC domain-containing protein [Thermoanaerobaculia bacterium]